MPSFSIYTKTSICDTEYKTMIGGSYRKGDFLKVSPSRGFIETSPQKLFFYLVGQVVRSKEGKQSRTIMNLLALLAFRNTMLYIYPKGRQNSETALLGRLYPGS